MKTEPIRSSRAVGVPRTGPVGCGSRSAATVVETSRSAVAATVLAALVGVGGLAQQASADVILSVSAEGASTVLTPGGQITLAVVAGQPLSSPVTPFNSAIFTVECSLEGVVLMEYLWQTPFETGTALDDSSPRRNLLPLPITNALLDGPGTRPDTADFLLSNVLPTPGPGASFQAGLLARFTIQIPDSLAGAQFTVRARPDTFALGFDAVPAALGTGVTIVVLPTPSAGMLLAGAAGLLSRRRRHPSKNS